MAYVGEVCLWARKLSAIEGGWVTHRVQNISRVGTWGRSQGGAGHHKLHHEVCAQQLIVVLLLQL